ncbi:hypothetical protein BH24ACT7_BH24ACT7_12730 [soil metagenome]
MATCPASLPVVLRFTLAGIPVGVHVSFLIIAVVSPSNQPVDMAVWVVIAFLAVLLHEAGHAFTARHFGADPVSITLFALGGVTTFAASKDLTPRRRLVIASAGSLVGITVGGLVWLIWSAGVFDDVPPTARLAASGFIWASLGWGLLNWIPIRPLDGGAMLTSFLEIVIPRRAVPVAKVVSAVTGAVAAFALWRIGSTFGAFFVVLITLAGLRSEPAEVARTGPTPGGMETTRAGDLSDDEGEPPAQPPAFPI